MQIIKGITIQDIKTLFDNPSIKRLKNDYNSVSFFKNDYVDYYSCFVGSKFVGAYMVIKISPCDYEIHSLLLPTSVRYSREFGKIILEELFKNTNRVSTLIREDLKKMQNHVLKLGFKLEGIKKEFYSIDGIKQDCYLYAILKKEFECQAK